MQKFFHVGLILYRGVVTALKPVRAERVRRPEPPVALGVRGVLPHSREIFKKFRMLNAISCNLVHKYLAASADIMKIFITVQFTLLQSAVLLSHVVHLSVRPSVCLSV